MPKEIDKNGYVTFKRCPITAEGVFEYLAGQVGAPGDPNRVVKVYRSAFEISNPETLRSFKEVPFLNEHTFVTGDPDNLYDTPTEEKGVQGIITSNVYFEAPWVYADLKVYSVKFRDLIENGKKEVSVGYSCDYEPQAGIFDGQTYEYIQKNLICNHIALVDAARVQGARVVDGRCFDSSTFNFRQ